MILKWKDIYSVNIKEIDEQHKKLFSLANNVLKIKEEVKKEVEEKKEELKKKIEKDLGDKLKKLF